MREQTIDRTTLLNTLDKLEKNNGYISRSVSSAYTINARNKIKTIFVTTGAGSIPIGLPPSADVKYRIIEIIKVDSGAGTVTVDGEGAETINGRATLIIGAQYHGIRIKCTGTAWCVVDWIAPPRRTYTLGTTYNGVALVLSGAGITGTNGTFAPYQTIDGAWRLAFNLNWTMASFSRTISTATIAGVAFPSYFQSCSGYSNLTASVITIAFAVASSGNFSVAHQSGTTTSYVGSGDVLLASKPTWAD
jgi:hypothetical protein